MFSKFWKKDKSNKPLGKESPVNEPEVVKQVKPKEPEELKSVEEIKIMSDKSLITSNYFKTVFFLLLSVLVVVGNYFLESRFVAGEEIVSEKFSTFLYEQENIIPNNGIIRFADENMFGFTNSIEVVLSGEDNDYIFDIASGKIWGNFIVSDAKVNIVAGNLVIIPNHAVFDLEFDGERVILSVFDGDVYLGFLEKGYEISTYQNEYSSLFMNKMLVPRDTQVNIPLNKLDDRIRSLLYSKLVKEFKYSAIPSSLEESDWVVDNQNNDKKFIETIRQNYLSKLIYKGVSVDKSSIGKFIFWAEENLTFITDKKRGILFNHLFEFLDDAIYYANQGDEEMSKERWSDFNVYFSSISENISKGEEFYQKFDQYIEDLSIFNVEHNLHGILKKMLDKKLTEKRDVYEVLNMFWLDVYEGINSNPVAAEEALNLYFDYFDRYALGKIDDMDFYRDFITFNNQLFDNLLLRFPIFYKDDYFAIKNVLEYELISLYETGQLKDELTQAIISTKISFLKRLRRAFFDGEVSVEETKIILSRLIEEVDDLMPSDASSVAVIELFETELSDIGDFWGYLNSPEYHTSRIYGATHEERYETYLDEKDKIWSIVNIQEDVLGEPVQDISVKEVEDEIYSVFNQISDVSKFELGSIEDITQRYVNVSGVIGGYPFEAVYDRDKNTLKDVYTYGELVSDRSVKVENLLPLMKEKFADIRDVEVDEGEEYTEETLAQRAARLFVSELISEYDFDVEIDDVSIVDELNAVYRVEQITLGGNEDVLVTFDFMSNSEKVTNLFLAVKGSPVVLEGKFTLEELKNIVLAEGELNPEGAGILR